MKRLEHDTAGQRTGVPSSRRAGVSSVAEIYDSAQVCKIAVKACAASKEHASFLRGKINISNNISKES